MFHRNSHGFGKFKIYFIWLWALLIQQCVFCLRLQKLIVPNHVIRGQTLRLECYFDLEKETLYSVKWYKDGHEFYRFVPRDDPPSQFFPLNGIHVDMDNSTQNIVTLTNVQLPASGTFKCEVSGEAPIFQTVRSKSELTVVVLPVEGPKITGGRPRYQPGDKLRVNCTSGSSKPAAQLNWFINGLPANRSLLKGPYVIITGREGLETTVLGLEFTVKHRHFRRGDLKLKCLATIVPLYWKSNEESVEGEKPPKASVLESRGTATPSSSRADRVQGVTNSIDKQRPHLIILIFYWLLIASSSG